MKNWEETVLGSTIRVQAQKLDEGWDVGIFGGCRTHVGAVTLAEPDGTVRTLERSGHKDSFICIRWAEALAKCLQAPVYVRCGIHYDNATPEQVKAIVAACDRLLETVISQITGK